MLNVIILNHFEIFKTRSNLIFYLSFFSNDEQIFLLYIGMSHLFLICYRCINFSTYTQKYFLSLWSFYQKWPCFDFTIAFKSTWNFRKQHLLITVESPNSHTPNSHTYPNRHTLKASRICDYLGTRRISEEKLARILSVVESIINYFWKIV